MHILCVAVAAIAVVSGLYAGGGQDVGSGDRVKIAYIVKAMTDQFWIDMRNGAEQTAKELNADLSFQAPDKETDVERQIQMVENAIISKVDAIILSAASSQALIPAIVKANKANKANIPVILVNDTIDEAALREDGGFVETYVGIDQYKSAALAGEYAAKNLSDCKILLLCFSQGDFVIFFKIFGPPDRSRPAFALFYAVLANCAPVLLLPAQRRTSYSLLLLNIEYIISAIRRAANLRFDDTIVFFLLIPFLVIYRYRSRNAPPFLLRISDHAACTIKPRRYPFPRLLICPCRCIVPE